MQQQPKVRPWTGEELHTLRSLRAQRVPFNDIAERLNRTIAACQATHSIYFGERRSQNRCAPEPGDGGTRAAPKVSQLAEINRRKRQEAQDRQTLTGIIFGDPPPGFSALDRRGA